MSEIFYMRSISVSYMRYSISVQLILAYVYN